VSSFWRICICGRDVKLVALGMPRPGRSPGAFLVKGGKRWIRVPRPRPPSSVNSESDDDDGGYDTCDPAEPRQLASALFIAAESVAERLYQAQDADAAGLIEALCDRLRVVTGRARRLNTESLTTRSTLRRQEVKIVKLSNQQGQCARYWNCANALQRKNKYLECATGSKHQRPPDWIAGSQPDWIAAWPGCMQ